MLELGVGINKIPFISVIRVVIVSVPLLFGPLSGHSEAFIVFFWCLDSNAFPRLVHLHGLKILLSLCTSIHRSDQIPSETYGWIRSKANNGVSGSRQRP